MVKLDYNQARKVHKLIREECCNCVDGNCILLDDSCVQLISQQYIYCNYFLRAVLPQDKSLHAELSVYAETDNDAVGFYRKNGFNIMEFSETYDGATVVRYKSELTK